MIDFSSIFDTTFEVEPQEDWTCRTFWVCPDELGIADILRSDPDPVAAKAAVEAALLQMFADKVAYIRSLGGQIASMGPGEAARDQVYWNDPRIYYPIHVWYFSDPPEQAPRPYHLPPMATPSNRAPSDLFRAGHLALRTGNYSMGWPLYEYRWMIDQALEQRQPFMMPQWNGRARPRKLLVHAEQGYGDVFMFSRFLIDLAAAGVDFDFLCYGEMLHAMKLLPIHNRILSMIDPLEEYDYHLPLCSLPLAGQIDVTKPRERYLSIDRPGIPNSVGICWSGRITHENNAGRSITLEQVLSHVPEGATIYSLQKGPCAEQLRYLPSHHRVIDYTSSMQHWGHTATFVASMSQVITVDTAVAHLAGALGRPTKLLLAGSKDWRWGVSGKTTHWYPTMEIVR